MDADGFRIGAPGPERVPAAAPRHPARAMKRAMGLSTTELGKQAEDFALAYLQQQNLALICRNFRCRFGEIDLILRDKNTVVFVEVRWRRNNHFLAPQETIDRRKRDKLVKTGQLFIQSAQAPRDSDFRFDVVALTGVGGGRKIEWIKNAF